MTAKILINVVLILGLIVVQNFFWSLPLGLSFINLAPVVLVFVLALFGPELALVWALALGVMFDVLGFGPVGGHLVALAAVWAVAYLLLANVVTDRSLYSLIFLAAVAGTVDKLAGILINLFFGRGFAWGLLLDWRFYFKPLLAEILLASILFYFFNLITKRIKPVFLIDSRRKL